MLVNATNQIADGYIKLETLVEKESAQRKLQEKDLHKKIPVVIESTKETQVNKKVVHKLAEKTPQSSNLLPSRFIREQFEIEYIIQTNTAQILQRDKIEKHKTNCSLKYEQSLNFLLLAEICRNVNKTSSNSTERETAKLRETSFLDKAKQQNAALRSFDRFNHLYYYMESMIMEYQGIDCLNLEQVESYIKLLRISRVLNNKFNESKETLNKAIDFLKKRWKGLVIEGAITAENEEDYLGRLRSWLHADPIPALFLENSVLFEKLPTATIYDLFLKHPKFFQLSKDPQFSTFFGAHPELTEDAMKAPLPELFLKYPGLFNLSNDPNYSAFFEEYPRLANIDQTLPILFLTNLELLELGKNPEYSPFFESYPDFVSPQAFAAKYPESSQDVLKKYPMLRAIDLNAEQNASVIRTKIAEGLKSPFVSELFMISIDISDEIARILKDGMLDFWKQDRILTVWLGSQKSAQLFGRQLKATGIKLEIRFNDTTGYRFHFSK